MATERPDRIPETKAQWRARHTQLVPKPLHDWEDLRSASEITEQQFLALRVIWPTRMDPQDFDGFENLDADFEQARAILKQLKIFQNYKKHIKDRLEKIEH